MGMIANKKGGFSLIEVVVSMAVLAIGMLGFIGLYGTGFKALRGSSYRTTAVRHAQDQMETLRLARPVATSVNNPPTDIPEAGMERTWSIAQSQKNPNTWVISVEVSWQNQEGQTKKVVFKSLRST